MARTSVFISYRRSDSGHASNRIADRLQARFGDDRVFIDVDSIEFGVNYQHIIDERLAKTDVFLVVIGDHWLDAQRKDGGGRRLDDREDPVRMEVAAALARGEAFPVIPVLIGEATAPPGEHELPDDLKTLSKRNSIRLVPDGTFEGQMERLIGYIEKRSEQRRTGLVPVPAEPESMAEPVAAPRATEETAGPPSSAVSAEPERRSGGFGKVLAGAVVLLVGAFLVLSGDGSGDGETGADGLGYEDASGGYGDASGSDVYEELTDGYGDVAATPHEAAVREAVESHPAVQELMAGVELPDLQMADLDSVMDALIDLDLDFEIVGIPDGDEHLDDYLADRTEPPAGSVVRPDATVIVHMKPIEEFQ